MCRCHVAAARHRSRPARCRRESPRPSPASCAGSYWRCRSAAAARGSSTRAALAPAGPAARAAAPRSRRPGPGQWRSSACRWCRRYRAPGVFGNPCAFSIVLIKKQGAKPPVFMPLAVDQRWCTLLPISAWSLRPAYTWLARAEVAGQAAGSRSRSA